MDNKKTHNAEVQAKSNALHGSELNDKSSQQIGRKCRGKCGRFKPWNSYNRKPKGLNGRDSRCKVCIKSTKKKFYKQKTSLTPCSFHPNLITESKVEVTKMDQSLLESLLRNFIFEAIMDVSEKRKENYAKCTLTKS